ncbi:ABC transporter ATP-binding protein [Tessaracoccus caeni]|uniref:ABC transporter ATP-binding protein n=1 Tax=Tessaracoccus caeni TaxID=3031239 RepID=UPI0023D9A09F|nr:ABC transporter ATP-binding protein [Tessaracoccus caeni]MDF1486879.1 ABC transporter ATP-binding protein [Tessaracoccus caeni]
MTAAIATHRLRKEFGKIRALDDLDVEIPRGSIFGLIGHNGAGKTTLMRILLDIARPTSGSATVLGEDPRDGGAALRSRIGFLPGELRLDPKVNGRDHLAFWASLGAHPSAARAEAKRLAEELDVRLGDASRKLSKGNKQKLGIIQAFMHRPELVILDEPTSGLDPLVQQQVLRLVSAARDGGATVFLSSHVMSEIEQVADTAAVLNKGRLVTVAPMSELRASATRHVRALVRGTIDEVAAVVAQHGLGLDVVQGDGEVAITGLLDGKPKELVTALSKLDVVSLVVAEPDLEERVLDMYEVN